MKNYRTLLFFSIAISTLFWACQQQPEQAVTTDSPVSQVVQLENTASLTEKAQAFLGALDETQHAAATFEFESEERFKWHFTPIPRKGVDWRTLNESQRQLGIDLLHAVLSDAGYQKAREIMGLEAILKVLEKRKDDDDYRDPEKYFVSIYGEPSNEHPWGWRFEGHHLSLNFSSVDQHLSITPAFMGSNPGEVREGPHKGKRVLEKEEDMGRSLLMMFTTEQLAKVMIAEDAPDEIVTLVEKKVHLEEKEGLSYAEMTPDQQAALLDLVHLYLNNSREHIAKNQWGLIEAGGLEHIHFAWAGGNQRGDRHYYRIHGPHLLIEYDNTQNDANHVHTVLRDPEGDFGEDLLRKHYEESDHHAQEGH